MSHTNGRTSTASIGVIGVFHETNTFAPGRTELAQFETEWVVGSRQFHAQYEGTRTSMGGVIDAARETGLELRPGLYTQATPSGIVADEAFEAIVGAMLDTVDADVDGLVVILHGAMVCESYPDAEGELLRRLRGRVGRELPIAVTVDLHANMSQAMVDCADFIVGYDTYPHVDVYDRAVEAVKLLRRRIDGEVSPVRRYVHSGMLVAPQAMLTDAGAMKELMERAFAIEREPGVLNVTVLGGFPYSDVPDAGMSFVVTTDGDAERADRYARELAELAWSLRERFAVRQYSPAEAVTLAMAHPEGPVVLTESSDNVGGGSPADATHLLPHLLGASKPSLIVIRDPEAAKLAASLGVGAEIHCAVGGKTDDVHGAPVPIRGTVRTLFDGHYRHIGEYMTGQRAHMGLTAVVEAGNVTVVLTENRVAPWDPGHVKFAGLQPELFHVIVVKSALAWKTAFGDMAKLALDVDTPGCCSANLRHFPYKRVRRPIYPLDEDFAREECGHENL